MKSNGLLGHFCALGHPSKVHSPGGKVWASGAEVWAFAIRFQEAQGRLRVQE